MERKTLSCLLLFFALAKASEVIAPVAEKEGVANLSTSKLQAKDSNGLSVMLGDERKASNPEIPSRQRDMCSHSDYVSIWVPKTKIIMGKDALNIVCKPRKDFTEIISYQVNHQNTSGYMTECTWTYNLNMEGTSKSEHCDNDWIKENETFSLPSGNATLQIHIDKNNVSLADAGNYSCKVSGITISGAVVKGEGSGCKAVTVEPKPNGPDENDAERDLIVNVVVSLSALVIVAGVGLVVFCMCRRRRCGNGQTDERRNGEETQMNMLTYATE